MTRCFDRDWSEGGVTRGEQLSVTTLEGWDEDPLQRIFHERFAVQCGYCAPGMLMAARSLLVRNPSP